MDIIASWTQNGLLTLIPFFILVGILVFVHEAGHFWVAKACGVRVEIFSLGFGPKLVTRVHQGTEYCLSLFPLGGYVKLYGADINESIAPGTESESFSNKTVAQRMAILFAGPLMNLLFAAVAFAGVAYFGMKLPAAVVGDIAADSKAYLAGFRAGDVILSLDDHKVTVWNQVDEYISAHPNTQIKFKVQRHEKMTELTVPTESVPSRSVFTWADHVGQIPGLDFHSQAAVFGIRKPPITQGSASWPEDLVLLQISGINGVSVKLAREVKSQLDELTLTSEITIEGQRWPLVDKNESLKLKFTKPGSEKWWDFLNLENPELYLSEVMAGSAAERAGIRPLDRIVSINGSELVNWNEMVKSVRDFDPQKSPLSITLRRHSDIIAISVIPEPMERMSTDGLSITHYTLGVISAITTAAPPKKLFALHSFQEIVEYSLGKAGQWSSAVLLSLVRMFTAEVSTKNIGGPLAIGKVAAESFSLGWVEFLFTMAIISINLFILNLLPVPVLDGGHIFFLIIEGIRGERLSERSLMAAQNFGVLMIMALMALAFYNDISSWFRNLP